MQICNNITEVFYLTIYHPFKDTIQYNTSLEMPTGWSYSGNQLINISNPENRTLTFNVTSSIGATQNVTINATVNYTYVSTEKQRKLNKSVEEGSLVPMLEVIRETPILVANNTEFVSNLILHNRGCVDVLNSQTPITFTDNIPSGWVAFAPTLDGVSAGTADIPNRKIIFRPGSIDKIRQSDYRLVSYKVLSPATINTQGEFQYNLTWENYEEFETISHKVNTTRYQSESHFQFNLNAVNSFRNRSAEANVTQLYNLSIKNIGDMATLNNTWNITATIPTTCNVSNYGLGNYTNATRKLAWNLSNLSVGSTSYFSFNMTCQEFQATQEHILLVEAMNNTKTKTTFSNNTNINCGFTSGNNCGTTESFTFTKPSNAKYETLDNLNLTIFYNFYDYNVTVGQGSVNISDDKGNQKILWQNYTIDKAGDSQTVFTNYTLDTNEEEKFVSASRNIGIKSSVDSTSTPNGNVTVKNIAYTWNTGKQFNDSQELFLAIHPFIFDLTAPTLQAPLNDSLQGATPIGLSWETISAPESVNITYYIYGDTTDASTLIDETTDSLYLWRDLGATQDTFYWKIIAGDGTTNKTSDTWQFDLDLCQSDTNYNYASTYPMSYNETLDTIYVWGSNGTDFDVMGSNISTGITFEQIFEFGRYALGYEK